MKQACPSAFVPFVEGSDSRAWFVQRIRAQAKIEGGAFVEFEEEYLRATEQGNDEHAVRMLERLKGQPWTDFDSRISGLAWRAYQRDLQENPNSQEQYDLAMHALANVDEYPNLGMFVSCIGLKTPPEELDNPRSGRYWLIGLLLLFFFIVMTRGCIWR